jgi:hypothetical protein
MSGSVCFDYSRERVHGRAEQITPKKLAEWKRIQTVAWASEI